MQLKKGNVRTKIRGVVNEITGNNNVKPQTKIPDAFFLLIRFVLG